MESTADRAIAIVGTGAILPDARNVPEFWKNIKSGRYSITEVRKDRWDPVRYYDPDHSAPDKTYSKIGGWVRDYPWEPVKWHLAVPPRVVDAMDEAQKWAIACTREALEDYGYPNKPLDADRTAVILGNAMAGEKHYLTALRVFFPEYANELEASASFSSLPETLRRQITRELHERIAKQLPEVTEDSMPGELSNCIAGRIANIFNFHGPNYVVDAACASAMAAISSTAEGLIEHDFDAAITGGVDRNMGAPTFVKFCKIGALSATGTRPYAEGADGFVMGEGAAIFLMKRLADAERDGDKIYAVLRGMGGSSDGKGKGITAPNPIGQKFSIERAWQNAGLSPATATYIEGHGTSTAVGDVVEVQSMNDVLNSFDVPPGAVAIGSVKSNFGHLKGAAGAAGLLKTVLALRDKVLPPSVHCDTPNREIDFAHSPLYVNTSLKPWSVPPDATRCAGVSAFGFGGTNFHAVLEEYVPGKINGNGKRQFAAGISLQKIEKSPAVAIEKSSGVASNCLSYKAPLRGALVIGAPSLAHLMERLSSVQKEAETGHAPTPAPPQESDLKAPERLAIDYCGAKDLAEKCSKAQQALATNQPAIWKALRAQGIYRGSGPAPKVAFLFTGQGSQYVNMLAELRASEPIVAETFAEADRVMTPLLGKPLSEFVFVDPKDEKAVARAEEDLRQTAITQPAVLATDLSLTRFLAAYGIEPDMTMGHSLGEYGALVASGALPFEDALEAVSARGREMTRAAVKDNGRMAAIFAPIAEIEGILKMVDGYVVIANINSEHQAVIGGTSQAVEQACEIFAVGGYNVVPLPVSHAFHTSIVAPASEPLRRTLERLHLQSPKVPVVANVNGEFYPSGTDVQQEMLDLLAKQVASPVQFVKGLRTLYSAGARAFVEVGPKKALQGFAEDVLGEHPNVISLFTNHPKNGELASLNQALCALYAAGLGRGISEHSTQIQPKTQVPIETAEEQRALAPVPPERGTSAQTSSGLAADHYVELGHIFADALQRGLKIWRGDDGKPAAKPVVITGASLGLPGTERIFDDNNIARILRGDQFIDLIPTRLRQAMLGKHITRLMKSDKGGPTFENITSVADVIKLAGRGGDFDLEQEFGVSGERVAALDRVTALAIAAGIDALRDAGIPLVMRYKTTSKGTQLPDRWMLPDALRDDTGVIFASVFPGFDSLVDEVSRYYIDRERREKLSLLESLLTRTSSTNGNSALAQEITRRIEEMRSAAENEPYTFERRFLFRVLSMGHSQFAEFIGARGPNTQINAACASTTQAVAVAEDWINTGRCRRVVIVSADDVTSDHLLEWMGAGFLASGAAATDEVVEDAATPFDRRRHGMIMGMGAAALVIESAEAAKERGISPICEVLSAVTANSAFHGTRLDVEHIGQVMEGLLRRAEVTSGISRQEIAPHTVFVSHETYTPARGGSASAEIFALRRVFGEAADRIVIANTKGLTGHAMGTGIEDVVAVKALETGLVPPVANFKEIDPELGNLNLSKGGTYPVEYALRLGAGFGSQISMTLFRWTATKDRVRRSPESLGYAYRIVDPAAWNGWLRGMSGQPEAELEIVRHTLRVRIKKVRPQLVEGAPEEKKIAAAIPAPRGDLLDSVIAEAARRAEVKQARDVEAQIKNESTPVAMLLDPAPKTEPTDDPVKQRVLSLVSVKTGYPPEMLDLDLDLEADLGIDTVKQAEVFAAIREFYNIPRDENRRLRDFPTLAHVIRFVHDKRTDLPGADAPVGYTSQKPKDEPTQEISVPNAPTPEPVPNDAVKERVLALVVEKTGYPSEMLDLDLDLEADLGIDTVKQAEMFAAIREIYNIPRDENRKLRDYPTLAHVIRFVYEKRSDLRSAVPAATSTAAPPVAPTPESPRESIATDDHIKEKVLDIVAEKTGYPKDMLDLDLDLEADLGIDTVKQAEMFASVRAAFNIPRDENLRLRDFPTLARVIQFARERISAQTAATAHPLITEAGTAVAPQQTIPTATPDTEKGTHALPTPLSFDAANAVPRRVPIPNLRPPLSLCKSTGVTLDSGKRVVIMPDKRGIAEALNEQLRSRGADVLTMDQIWPAEAIAAHLKTWLEKGPVMGVYWLPALDEERNICEMNLADWHEALRVRIKSLYYTMRTLYRQIGEPGTFLISGTNLGGLHGYDESGAARPLGGAVTGFAKTFKRERGGALTKAVDFALDAPASEIAASLIEETLRDPGAVEIGYKMGLRWTIGLEEQPIKESKKGMVLNSDSVFLITGAAGSIVSAITADLAAASGGTFYLLDLVPEPKRNDPDLKQFLNGKEELKRDLYARIQARGERATPAMVEKELAALERAVAARNAIDAIHAAGGRAHYFAADLTNPVAVASVVEAVREFSGHIDVLLHAAGMEKSHFLPEKYPREFDLVFDVKTDGWFNLLRAIGDMPVGAAVVFSSIAGRFGNGGQADYSAANDLLCKFISNFRTTRPKTRGIAIDWTAWGGIGMATRGSIPKMMEAAGIDMLPPEAGIPVVRRELTTADVHGEIVIGKRLGALVDECDVNGGLNPNTPLTTGREDLSAQGPMIGTITRMSLYDGLRIETMLDPKLQPFLYDHQIEGMPVLPGVMGIEAFAESALTMLPGWHIAAIENVNFLAPFKFYRNEPRKLIIRAKFRVMGDEVAADCELVGSRMLPNQAAPQENIHFTGRVRLTKGPREAQSSCGPGEPTNSIISSEAIYRLYFHGPAYRVLQHAWWDGKRTLGTLAERLPANHVPAGKATIMEPRLIELCFQTAGLWEMSALGRLGLPLSVHEIRLHRSPETAQGGVFAVVTSNDDGASFDAEVVDKSGSVFLSLRSYRTVAFSKIEAEPLKLTHAVAV